MKKALSTICVYDRDIAGRPIILSLTVIDRQGAVYKLIANNVDHPYGHKCFAELYCDVLSVCNSNGFKIPFATVDDDIMYNIQFITMEKYSCEYGTPTRYCLSPYELQHYMLNIM